MLLQGSNSGASVAPSRAMTSGMTCRRRVLVHPRRKGLTVARQHLVGEGWELIPVRDSRLRDWSPLTVGAPIGSKVTIASVDHRVSKGERFKGPELIVNASIDEPDGTRRVEQYALQPKRSWSLWDLEDLAE